MSAPSTARLRVSIAYRTDGRLGDEVETFRTAEPFSVAAEVYRLTKVPDGGRVILSIAYQSDAWHRWTTLAVKGCCPRCEGWGKIGEWGDDGFAFYNPMARPSIETCPMCKGTKTLDQGAHI